jgi:hypothetical protein
MAGKEVRGNPTGILSLGYNPHQQAFLSAIRQRTPGGRHAFHRVTAIAGRRGGKTVIGGVAVGDRMSTLPSDRSNPSLGWICAPTYPDLHDFVIPQVFKTIPHAWIGDWSEQHYTLELKNYAQAMFRSLDDPEKARGPGLDWAWIDETRKVQQLAWNTMLPALTDKRGQAFFTTSPNGFDWCYETFWLPALQGRPGYFAVKYKTADNPLYQTPEGQAELADAKASMDPLFYQQEFEADFVTFEGAIYGALLDSQIVRTDEQIKRVLPEWPHIDPSRTAYVGVDPGGDHPFAAVLGVMGPRGLVLVGEYLSNFKPIHEHVFGLEQMCARWNPSRPFDPSRWCCDKSQRQFMIELAQPRYGIYLTPAPNQVEDGIRRVQSWLAQKQLWFLLPEADPRLGVPQCVDQHRNYRWAENTSPDGQTRKEKVFKRKDDLPDATRYLLMGGPTLETPDPSPSGGKRDLSDFDELTRYEIEEMRRREHRPRAPEEIPFFATELDPPGMLEDVSAGDFWL